MSDVREFIESGILELYVLGDTDAEQTRDVERMAATHEEVRAELKEISEAVEAYATAHALEPNPTLKPFLLGTIDYMTRMANGEQPTVPPLLTERSRVDDYAEWLNRDELQLREPLRDGALVRIIGHTPEATTAIVWLKEGAPPETHTAEHEKFLVVEGTCDITINEKVHSLSAGDVLIIPLHATHWVRVTSDTPCKIILQRAAA